MQARELCQQIGDTPEVFKVLWGLLEFYRAKGILQRARELGEQLISLAQHQDDPTLLITAHASAVAGNCSVRTPATCDVHL